MSAQFPAEQDPQGSFTRQADAFKGWVTPAGAGAPAPAEGMIKGSSGFPAVAGRYHLYVSWACPWAHRVILARTLMGLEDVIGMTAVDPVRDGRGWAFREAPDQGPDPINGFKFLSEAYLASDPHFQGRYTVPVLWDTVTQAIVSNDDDDLLRMFGTAFQGLARHDADLYPVAHQAAIDALNTRLYGDVNNGVYRAGFASAQAVYAQAVGRLFAALDELEETLATRRYLVTDHPVESDWRLFVTLIRFDAVYVGHFKCNLRRIVDYPHLWGYTRDLYQHPGVADTVKLDQIKRHYYMTHPAINPTRIVPVGPALDLAAPHGRERLS